MTLTTQTLPLSVTNGRTVFNVDLDASVGPHVVSIVDDGTLTIDPSYDFGAAIVDPADATKLIPDVQGGMWSLRGVDSDGNEVFVTPDQAQLYQVYGTILLASGEEADLFEWRDVRATSTQTFWVRIAIIKPASGEGIKWAGWFGRERGTDIRIEEFRYPTLAVQEYSGGGGTYIENAYRSRVLSLSLSARNRDRSPNHNVGLLANRELIGAAEYVDIHPAQGWPLGFWAMIALDNGVAGTLRRCLMFQVTGEDGYNPWAKLNRWRVINDTVGSAVVVKFAPGHLVRGSDGFGLPNETSPDGTKRLPTRQANADGPLWTPELRTFEAADQFWWHEVAEIYRDTFEARTPNFVATRDNTWRSTFGQSNGLACVTTHGVNTETDLAGGKLAQERQLYYRTFVPDLATYLRNQTDFPLADRLVKHYQTTQFRYRNGLMTVDRNFKFLLPDLLDNLAAQSDAGWLTSAYTLWLETILSPDYGWNQHELEDYHGIQRSPVDPKFPTEVNEALLRTISVPSVSNELLTDVEASIINDRPGWPERIARGIARIVEKLGLGAAYIDALGNLSTRAANHPSKEPYASRTAEGQRDLVRAVKEKLGTAFHLQAEGPTEGLNDADTCAAAEQNYPFHDVDWGPELEAAQAALESDTPVSYSASVDRWADMPTPPLWQIVHNLDQPGLSFATSPTFAQCAFNSTPPLAGGGVQSFNALAHFETGDVAITATASASAGTETEVTSAGHGYREGDKILVEGTTSYNGRHIISAVTTNTYVIPVAFVANETGTCSRVARPDLEDWLHLQSFAMATHWIQGQNLVWLDFPALDAFGVAPSASSQAFAPISDGTGSPNDGTNGTNGIDPTGIAGPPFMSYLRDMIRSWSASIGGEFLNDGRMAKPMTPSGVTQRQNPLAASQGFVPASAFFSRWFAYQPTVSDLLTQGVDEFFGTHNRFGVDAVIHTTWISDRTGAVGAVLTNWSDAVADATFTFDPTQYGIAGSYTVDVRQPGASPTSFGPFTGSITIVSASASSGDVYLGHLPPRSMRVLVFS